MTLTLGHASATTPAVFLCNKCQAPNLVLYPHRRGDAKGMPQKAGTTMVEQHRIKTTRDERWYTYRNNRYRMPVPATDPATVLWPDTMVYDALTPHHAYYSNKLLLRCGATHAVIHRLEDRDLRAYQAGAHADIIAAELRIKANPHETWTGYATYHEGITEHYLMTVRWCQSLYFDLRSRVEIQRWHRDAMLAAEIMGGESAVLELLRAQTMPWTKPPSVVTATASPQLPTKTQFQWRALEPHEIILGLWDA